jgi:hypothetical protein
MWSSRPGMRPAGADLGEVVLQRLDRLAHLLLG